MRKHPRVSGRPSVEQCFCSPGRGFVCSLHRDRTPAETIEESDALTPDLAGYGYRTGYSLDPDGEWISPEQDKEEEFIRAANQIFEVGSR